MNQDEINRMIELLRTEIKHPSRTMDQIKETFEAAGIDKIIEACQKK